MKFRDEAIARKWFASKDRPTATHLMMDGGRLAVPDDQGGAFLNIYFASVVIRGEKLSLVEVKSPVFRLFFDLDIRFNKDAHGIQRTIRRLCRVVWEHVTNDFFAVSSEGLFTDPQSSLSSMETAKADDPSSRHCNGERARMIICQAPSKIETIKSEDDSCRCGVVKHGVHIVFPNIFVNSPIALACRDKLLGKLPLIFPDHAPQYEAGDVNDSSTESTASTSGFAQPVNSWSDIVDDSVFRGSGLRMIFSSKGRGEGRAYVPKFEMDQFGDINPCSLETAAAKRSYIHDTSIRVTHNALTPCMGGEHEIADKPGVHAHGDCVVGTSTSIDMYQEVLPKLREVLPAVYKDTRFINAFVTTHAVMIKTNSRYCQNKRGEHATSTIYLCISKRGVCQRCYCRKEERGCADYASPVIPLPMDVVRVFFPDETFLDDPEEVAKKKTTSLSAKKRKTSSLQNILKRSRVLKKL